MDKELPSSSVLADGTLMCIYNHTVHTRTFYINGIELALYYVFLSDLLI